MIACGLAPGLRGNPRSRRSQCTRALLDRLADLALTAELREEVIFTLSVLCDPRAEAPLFAMLEDLSLPNAVRDGAGRVLAEADAISPERAMTYWAASDAVLKHHALVAMGNEHAGIIESIAVDPAHSLRAVAIRRMTFGFESPRSVALRIAALGNANPTVRVAAVDSLLFDEPVEAESALIKAAQDSDPEVALAALSTLAYYPTTKNVRALANLSTRGNRVGKAAAQTLEYVRGDIEAEFRSIGASHDAFERWLEPIAHLFRSMSFEPCEGGTPSPRLIRAERSADAILALMSDPDGVWAEKKARLRDAEVRQLSASERGRVTAALLQHRDPGVRELGARYLSDWNDHEALMMLANDVRPLVQKAAVYWLTHTSPDSRVAKLALERLAAPDIVSTSAAETFNLYWTHASRDTAIELAEHLAREDARQSVRYAAIRALADAAVEHVHAKDALLRLRALLSAPPSPSWSVHIALLEALRRAEVDPGSLEALRDVDHAVVQSSLARVLGR